MRHWHWVPGLPADGEPLSDDELGALTAISIDAMFDIPEPVYGEVGQ